uniref:Uncharacterized protein n=1 Tax=Timema poppense TaxID=170557 RepID=A0A7R9CYN7_TIMPO|nr:unnamed protein product [Timema poppensis]
MKVKFCTQVFSQRVSFIIRRPAQWSGVTISPEHLTPEAEDTADLLLFMDRLFDSVNGSSAVPIKEDDSEGALDSLRSFLQDDVLADSPQSSETCATAPRKEVVAPQSRIAVAAHTYITERDFFSYEEFLVYACDAMVGVVRTAPAYYNAAADCWNATHPGQVLSIYNVAETFKTAFEKATTMGNAVQGFCATGLCPMDKNKFTEADFLPAEVTDQDQEDENESNVSCEPSEVSECPPNTNSSIPAVPEEGPSNPTLEDSPSERPNEEPIFNFSNPPPPIPPGTSHEENIDQAIPGPSQIKKPPEDIIPLPKIQIKRKRSGRGLKSVILTSTPNKERLKQFSAEKETTKNNNCNK